MTRTLTTLALALAMAAVAGCRKAEPPAVAPYTGILIPLPATQPDSMDVPSLRVTARGVIVRKWRRVAAPKASR